MMLSPHVTVPTTIARSFSHPLVTTSTTTSTALSTTLHQVTSLPVAQTSHSHLNSSMALVSAGGSTLTDSIREKAAGEAFRKHRVNLQKAIIHPHILAERLYSDSACIISKETLNYVMLPTLTPAMKNMAMFNAIEASIASNPSSFSSLLDILKDDAQLCVFVEPLRKSYYGKCYIIV